MLIDTNHDTSKYLGQLKKDGVTGVFRYFDRLRPQSDKVIKAPEIRALAKAGLRLGIVYEGAGDKLVNFSEAIGEADAFWSRSYADHLGIPPEAAIYFAVDFDASPNDLSAHVIPYFRGVDKLLRGVRSVGVYGSGAVCDAVTHAGLARYVWLSCSAGWRGTRESVHAGRYHILQHLPRLLHGLDVDVNTVNQAHANDIGDYQPT